MGSTLSGNGRRGVATLLSDMHLPERMRDVLPEALRRPLQGLRARLLSRGLPRHAAFTQKAEDALASASVSIVLPIHDAPEVTRRCLASLEKFAPQTEVILVDDGSALQSTQAIIEEFRTRNNWEVVRHATAMGHSRACEAGALLATRPYLCFLNSDTVVTPWCWSILIAAFDADGRTGVVGPSTSGCCSAVAQERPLAGYCAAFWNDSQICAFAERLLREYEGPAVVDLDWVAGFALFIRRSLWDELGGFDPCLPDYGNEVDLCKRAQEMGHRTVWVRNAYIHHLGGESYKSVIGEEGIENRKREAGDHFARKHHVQSPG